jgi:hypothetical protein
MKLACCDIIVNWNMRPMPAQNRLGVGIDLAEVHGLAKAARLKPQTKRAYAAEQIAQSQFGGH